MTCKYCDDTGWVCEDHTDKPWDGVSNHKDACHCGGAGSPCEEYNTCGCNELLNVSGDTKCQ